MTGRRTASRRSVRRRPVTGLERLEDRQLLSHAALPEVLWADTTPHPAAAPEALLNAGDSDAAGGTAHRSTCFELADGHLRLRPGRSLSDAAGAIATVSVTVPETSSASEVRPMAFHVSVWASPWQNPARPLDVNRDGVVSPRDALLVIDQLNAARAGALPLVPDHSHVLSVFPDVNGDHYLSPIDALQVINHVNLAAGIAGEGTSTADPCQFAGPAVTPSDEFARCVITSRCPVNDSRWNAPRSDGGKVGTADGDPASEPFAQVIAGGNSRTSCADGDEVWPTGSPCCDDSELEKLITDLADEIAAVWSRRP